MKKTFNIFGIITLVTIIGVFIVACSDKIVNPNTITVTGIPHDYNGKFGTLLLYPYPNMPSTPTVYSMETINGTTIFSLLNWKRDDPWDGKGNFRITFLIYENVNSAANNPIYTGVLKEDTSQPITEKNTNMAWSLFNKK
jgi:hypothetical protein